MHAKATHIATHPHDDAPDTAEAFRRIAALPEGPEKEELRGQIVSAWKPMADRIAWQFRDRGESVEDLRQVAALGLVKAVNRYDPARGTAFPSYAVPTVIGEVKRHFRDHMWALHVPRHVQEVRAKVRAARQDLTRSLDDRGPSVAEIAEYTELTEQEVARGLEAIDTFSTVSLDAEVPGSGGHPLSDTLGTTDGRLETAVDREAVRPKLRELPERERTILYLRFFGDMTQSQIAGVLGISQMHVSRLITRTCARLRDEILADA